MRGPDTLLCSSLQPLLNSTNLSPEELGNSTLYRGPVDPANWFGIRKGYPNLGYIQVGEGRPVGGMLRGVPWP